ncbi:MAG TPA: hypothetical protein O0X19_03690 [Methanocorpusculum sp.]|nr:TrmB family transcriptional regulator [Candidatus Methanocorpusculum equi]MCQ2358258.1 hypothetical protein [Methanocorpusculum sp.]HJJ33465.1 hypothetical protein [Methanocorpusculum sp.]HJJ45095.1 hypothetical protein [Methanocorpusculum sp.]HJJ60025.1 hypothetical protein [Methanocorpusculum sp.]
MNDSEFLSEMLNIGMTEYEAKVYFILFQLKYASIRDISEICTVPRNKIYEVLDSLEEKGFASKAGNNPLRYALCDVEKTFNTIRIRELKRIDRAEQYLKKQEESARFSAGQHAYEFHSKWAVENHLAALVKKSRRELIIGVKDADYLNKNIPEAVLRKLARKIDLYVIVSSEEDAEKIPVRCYLMRKNFLNGLFDSEAINMVKERAGDTKLMLASDRNTILNINENANGANGMVMRMDDSFLVGLALETLLQNIVKL